MRNWAVRWVASTAALLIVSVIGIGVHVDSALALFAATIVIGLLNSVVRPGLKMLTMPLNCLTLGLFGFVINALLFFAAQLIVPGFHVDGIVAALIGSVLMGALSAILNVILKEKKEKDR